MASLFSLLMLSVFLTAEFTSAIIPKRCPNKYEVYNACERGCTRTCKNKDIKTLRCSTACKEGCFCIAGYVRNDQGVCVKPQACPKRCKDPHSIPGCQDCRKTCDIYRYPFKRPECPADKDCDKKCKCAPGYVLDEEIGGKCVVPERCNNIDCGPDQVYSSCAWNCSTYDDCPVDDSPRRQCSPPFVCNGGCVCQPGYLRDSETKICKPVNSCPVRNCTRPNEEWIKCVPPWTSDDCIQEDTSEDLLPKDCFPRCLCKKNYCRNEKGICVSKASKQCPNKNEVFKTCGTACPKTCENKDMTIPCQKNCKKGCFCIDGYVRNDKGECVNPKDCPVIGCGGDPNAVPGCGNHCGHSCNDYNKNVACTLICKLGGCDCKKGYVYDPKTEKCVLPENCTPKCNAANNEEYQECGSACPDTCENGGKPGTCTLQCVPGCFCKKGYLRRKDGRCVLPCDCPVIGCGGDPNAVPGCGNHCGHSCNDYKKNVACTLICKLGGCDCKKGYVYDPKTEKCVLPENCTNDGDDDDEDVEDEK